MIKELAIVFPAGKYTWFEWKKGKLRIESAKGREHWLYPGDKFGVRPATSKKGMFRVISDELGPGIIFSMDQAQVSKLTKNSVMAKVEVAALKTFTVRLFSRVIPGKFIKAYTMKAMNEQEAKRIADDENPMQTVEVTEHSTGAKVEVAASDKQILDFLSDNLAVKIELKDLKQMNYVRHSPKKVQLIEGFDADVGQLPYIIFTEGMQRSDSYQGVGKLGLTLPHFISWLEKNGAKKKVVKREKRSRMMPYYD